MIQPDRPGVWHFKGMRFGPTGRSFMSMNEIVQVEDKYAGMPYVVKFFGRDGLYPVGRCDGEWEFLFEGVEDAGAIHNLRLH